MSDHENDADKRPRLFGRVEVPGGEIELTVQGSEGESTDDLEGTFDEKLDKLCEKADHIHDEPDDAGVE